MSSIRLYHGTVYKFDTPDLSRCRPDTDFGRAFYMSDDLDKTKRYAKLRAEARKRDHCYVYMVKVDIDKITQILNVKTFRNDLNGQVDWIDYIVQNRNQIINNDECDLVIGKTADDDIDSVLKKYLHTMHLDKAMISVKIDLVKQLRPEVYGDQYAFKSDKAIRLIKEFGIHRSTYELRSGGLIHVQ